jgi:hypothetical protein
MATANPKRKPRLSKFESHKDLKLLILSEILIKKCSFASSLKFCVVLLIDTYTRLLLLRRSAFWADMSTLLDACVLVNAKALSPQEVS